MRGLFKRTAAVAAPDTSALGRAGLALRMPHGAPVPPGCAGVAFDKGGRTRRIHAGERIALAEHEAAFCFHPGPYCVDLAPFAAAPEIGLRLSFAIDAPDPRVRQQRFDLYLASEAGAGDSLTVAALAAAIEAALRHDLALGNLELPPCTTIDEWNVFRAGLNQLLYTRFGVTVDDCLPVDLGQTVDYAQLLLARAAAPQAASDGALDTGAPAFDAAQADAQAMRRLFLELPGMTSALRLVELPPGQVLFRQHQHTLQRLDRAGLDVTAMPALDLAAPGRPLASALQEARARHAVGAAEALDEAWALVARLAAGLRLADIVDEADRIVANLEFHLAGRRLAHPPAGEA